MRRTLTFLFVVIGSALLSFEVFGQSDLAIQGQILFVTDRDGNDEVYVMSPHGTGQTNISNNAASDSTPGGVPEGVRALEQSRWRSRPMRTRAVPTCSLADQ